jgi:hypothetical protein
VHSSTPIAAAIGIPTLGFRPLIIRGF